MYSFRIFYIKIISFLNTDSFPFSLFIFWSLISCLIIIVKLPVQCWIGMVDTFLPWQYLWEKVFNISLLSIKNNLGGFLFVCFLSRCSLPGWESFLVFLNYSEFSSYRHWILLNTLFATNDMMIFFPLLLIKYIMLINF